MTTPQTPMLKKEQNYKSTPPLSLRGLFEDEIYLYFIFVVYDTQII